MTSKKKLSEMSERDAFELFGIHADDGYFQFPFYRANHDNGWQVTNSFSKHILEANKEKLFELFDIDEEFYSKIENPIIPVSRDAILSDGTFIENATSDKLKMILRKNYGYKNSELKRGKSNVILQEMGIEFKHHFKPKYKLL